MTWPNRVQLTYLRGPEPMPTIEATLWWMTTRAGQLQRYVQEEVTVLGGSVVFTTEPPTTPQTEAISIGEAGWPGRLFRSLASENLPTPAPADPDGFIDIFVPDTMLVSDLEMLIFMDPFVRTLRINGGTITASIVNGSIRIDASQPAHTRPFPLVTVSETFTLRPIIEVPFDGASLEPVSTASTSVGPESDSDVRFAVNAATNALLSGFDREMYRHCAASLAQYRSPVPPVPDRPAAVTISARRVGIESAGVRLWPAMGSFGDVNVHLFGPRPTGGGGKCALQSSAVLAAASLDLAMLRLLRDRAVTTTGGAWLTDRYYQHGGELARILDARPHLARAAVDAIRRLLDELRTTGTIAPATVGRAMVLLCRLRRYASPTLRSDLTLATTALPFLARAL
jgi:hypothetical protein